MPTTPGRFVWYDLASPDPAASARFYGALFGWRIVEHGPQYRMIHVGDVGLGGIVQAQGGMPPAWAQYLTVADVERDTRRAEEMGGHVIVGVTPIERVGRFSVVADRQGAAVALLQLENEDAAERRGPGFFCWNELHTRDVADAVDFYRALVGWETDAVDMGEMGPYVVVKHQTVQEGGILKSHTAHPSHWLSYVEVDDVDASAKKAADLGATVFLAPRDIPGTGRFSVLRDPQGAVIAVYRSARMV